MQKIIVTGANGQVGKCLADIAAKYPNFEFSFYKREDMPLDDFALTAQIIADKKPDVIINAAAYTAVDKAETEKEKAFLINAYAVQNLAAACKNVNARFIQISTDFVFDGQNTTAYKETDTAMPLNIYGQSKLQGEMLALAANANSIIVRTSWVYSKHGNNFVKTMLRLMKERSTIGVVNDQTGCPTYAPQLVEALLTIAQNKEATPGIFHFCNSGATTWYNFATEIATLIKTECVVNAISTSQFPTLAKRPANSVLDNSKLEAVFGIAQTNWKQGLRQCLQELELL